MKNDLLLWPLLKSAALSIRNNLQIFSYFALIFALINYVFARIEMSYPDVIWGHLIAAYVFYYFFIRVYFWKKPIFETDNFFRSAGKMLIIILLAFTSVIILKIGFEVLKLFAKSLAVFPDLYGFLADSYAFLREWRYTNIFLFIFLFAVLMFTIFIPGFAWISTIIGKEQSIIFSIAETKEYHGKIFTLYFMLFGILPLFLTGLLIGLHMPLILMCIISAFFSILQIVVYLKMYEILFLNKM